MRWSSWNSFSNTVDSDVIVSQAKAMIASGMHEAGYQYINIDEGFVLGKRDAQGTSLLILNDYLRWRRVSALGDMSNIVRWHSQAHQRAFTLTRGETVAALFLLTLAPVIPVKAAKATTSRIFFNLRNGDSTM